MLLLAGWCDEKFVMSVMDGNGQKILHRISMTPEEMTMVREMFESGSGNIIELINSDHQQIG